MPQSSSKVIFHIIFSTKDRHPWLDANVRPRMHAYLATVYRDAVRKPSVSAVWPIMFT
jgi:putative transposase